MFRFSIRDLFWLTLTAALVVGWLLDRHPPNTWIYPLPTWLNGGKQPERNMRRDTSFSESRSSVAILPRNSRDYYG